METNESKERGARIRAIRKKLGLNQTEFGKLLDCEGAAGKTKGTISGYETGSINPSLDLLTQMAKIGECSFEEIATGKQPQKTVEIGTASPAGNRDVASDILGALKSLPLRQRYEMIEKVVFEDSLLPKEQVERKLYELLGPPWPKDEIEKQGLPKTESRARFIWMAACEEAGLSEPVFSGDYAETLQMFRTGDIDDLELFLVAKEWLGRIFGAQEKK